MEHLSASTSASPWRAIPALACLGADGLKLEIDLQASRVVGAAVIVATPARRRPMAGLTARQKEVAALLASGKSNKEIARNLGIELSTVKDHVHAILKRTGARSRTELIAWTRD